MKITDFSEVFFLFIQRPLIAVLSPCVFLSGSQTVCADTYVAHQSVYSFVDCPENSTRGDQLHCPISGK